MGDPLYWLRGTHVLPQATSNHEPALPGGCLHPSKP
jgi:hypothetical protein